jgi:hypothetical protein
MALVGDIRSAYGDRAKAFVVERLGQCIDQGDPEMEDYWTTVARVLWRMEPDAEGEDVGTLTVQARTIKLN